MISYFILYKVWQMPKLKKVALSSRTTSYEIVHKTTEYRPFSETLASSGVLAVQATNKMRMLQDLGWPVARYGLKDNRGKRIVVKKDDVIWLLKCKPSCWRLYFYVYEKGNERWIIYVYAVCKKRDEEDPQDTITARSIADARGPIAIFTFPAG